MGLFSELSEHLIKTMDNSIPPRGTPSTSMTPEQIPMEDCEENTSVNINLESLCQKPIKTYKRIKESETNDFTMAKKTAKPTIAPITTVNTFNYYTPLSTTMTTTTATPSTSKAESQPHGTNRPSHTPTPPAIVIEKKYATSRLLLSLKTTLEKDYVTSFNSQGLRIQCSAQEDYATLQMLLNTNKVQYFTYLATRRNYVKVILRGLPPNIAEEDILEELQGMKFPVISVRQLKRTQVDPETELRTKIPLPVWLLTLKNEAGAK